MTPLDAIVWALVAALTIVVLALATSLAILIVRAAVSARATPDPQDDAP